MVAKLDIVAAVPIGTAQLKECLRTVRRKAETENNELKESSVSSKSRRKRRNLTPAEKLNIRRARNKTAAEESRKKAKLEENFLKQKLLDLEYESMKLLLEHENLKRKYNGLELENQVLKMKVQSTCSVSMDKESDVEATFKHAEGVGTSQNFLHPFYVYVESNKECNESELLGTIYQQADQFNQQHKISTELYTCPVYVNDTSCMLPTQPHNTKRLMCSAGDAVSQPNFESACTSEKDLMELEEFENLKEFLGSFLMENQLNQEPDLFEVSMSENVESKVKMTSDSHINHVQANGHSPFASSETDKYSAFSELPPEWSFDNLYEEMSNDSSFYSC